jgi:hypothetical protein
LESLVNQVKRKKEKQAAWLWVNFFPDNSFTFIKPPLGEVFFCPCVIEYALL